MKIGNFEISSGMVTVLMLFAFTIWLGFTSGVFAKKTFWKTFWGDFAKGFLRVAIIVLVTQGLVFRAYLIEPAYLIWYNWIGFLGGLAYIIFFLHPKSGKKANE